MRSGGSVSESEERRATCVGGTLVGTKRGHGEGGLGVSTRKPRTATDEWPFVWGFSPQTASFIRLNHN